MFGELEHIKEETRFRCVYYGSRKRKVKRRLINEGRYDESLKGKVEESTSLG